MHPIIDELMNRWEESRERGQLLTPEQLCENHPELLDELKWQIKALNAVEAQFGEADVEDIQPGSGGTRSSKQHQIVRVTSEFHVHRLHASGGLGEVYLAKEPDLQRTVAIKFPRADRLSKDQLLRFEREAQITGRLNHPGIVPVHALQAGQSQQPCYVMRFVDGLTLQQRIDQLFENPANNSADLYASLEVRQLLQSFVTLCNIVAYAHQHGIIHRDIKPSNIILGSFGETLLMDWGLAKSVADPESPADIKMSGDAVDTVVERTVRTHTGQFMGTPAFASPEQRQGQIELIDGRSDVYSLGATLLTLLTGSLPSGDWMQKAIPTNRFGVSIPYRLAEICRKALAQKLELRYATVIELREDIERYLAGEPISVVAETVWSKLSRTIRKRSGWAAAILVAVSVSILAVGIGSLVLNQKNKQLQKSNKDLEKANAISLAAQERSSATTQLLTRAMRAATPEMAQGKEPTVKQLLNETSTQLKNDRTIPPLVSADTHQVLAQAYVSLGDYEQAQENADISYLLYCEQTGENSTDALNAQATVALILSRRDQDDEAIRVARDALQRGRASKDIDAETMAILLDTCGVALSNGTPPAFEESLSLHREAYEMVREHLGAEDPTTLRIACNYGVALMDADNLVEGELVLREAKEAHQRLLGPIHPYTLVDIINLITIKYNSEDYAGATELVQAYRKPMEDVFGPDHDRNLRLLQLLVMIAFQQGNLEDAERESRTALERASRSLGQVHHHTLQARGMLCSALVAQGKLDEADKLGTEQYELTEAEFGQSHPKTVQAITLLLDLAEARKDLKAMERWVEKLQCTEWADAAKEMLEKARKSFSDTDVPDPKP